LPAESFVIGDNAYVCSESLLTPLSGFEKDGFVQNFESTEDLYRADFLICDDKIQNSTATSAIHLNIFGVYSCTLQASIISVSSRVVFLQTIQTKSRKLHGCIPSDIIVTNIEGNSMFVTS